MIVRNYFCFIISIDFQLLQKLPIPKGRDLVAKYASVNKLTKGYLFIFSMIFESGAPSHLYLVFNPKASKCEGTYYIVQFPDLNRKEIFAL